MTRTIRPLIALVLIFTLLGATGCQRKVEVKTGTRVVCTYGHVITDNVRTISVPAKNASRYRIKTVTKTCDKHAQLEKLNAEAQDAIEKGDLKTAETKLKQIVVIDRSFGSAQSQLDTIAKGGTPAVNRSDTANPSKTDAGTKTPGESNPNTPQGKLTSWMPDKLTGYTAAKPALDVFSATREYVPGAKPDIIQLVIVAEQTQSAKTAAEQLARDVKSRHPKNSETIKINGHDVYFGTDGRRLAAVGFTDGSVMVAAQIVLKDAGSASGLKGELVNVVKQLP